MTATRQDIDQWFDRGLAEHAEFMIVVCDTYDHDDYPVYATNVTFAEKYSRYNGRDMQVVMEIYDLSIDKEVQLSEYRARNFPKDYHAP